MQTSDDNVNENVEHGAFTVKADRAFSTSLERGLSVLTSFTPRDQALTISEIASRTKMNRSTVHRYVMTLQKLGYLDQGAESGRYRLAIKVVDLGFTALNSMEARHAARPVLEEICLKYDATTNMGVLDGTDLIFAERIRSPGGIDINLNVGTRQPAYCTSMGKVLLAHLPPADLQRRLEAMILVPHGPRTILTFDKLRAELATIRERGFAINNEEYMFGLVSVAAPIRNASQDVVAAINMDFSAAAISVEELNVRYSTIITSAADEISMRLGHQGRASPRAV